MQDLAVLHPARNVTEACVQHEGRFGNGGVVVTLHNKDNSIAMRLCA